MLQQNSEPRVLAAASLARIEFGQHLNRAAVWIAAAHGRGCTSTRNWCEIRLRWRCNTHNIFWLILSHAQAIFAGCIVLVSCELSRFEIANTARRYCVGNSARRCWSLAPEPMKMHGHALINAMRCSNSSIMLRGTITAKRAGWPYLLKRAVSGIFQNGIRLNPISMATIASISP